MNNVKLLKKYTYMSILNIDFDVLIYFDEDNERLLFSLKFEDHNYNSGDYLVEFAKELEEEGMIDEIKAFMLDSISSVVHLHMEEIGCQDWEVWMLGDGLQLVNKKTNRSVIWKVHDLEEDCEFIQNEMIKFLNLQANK